MKLTDMFNNEKQFQAALMLIKNGRISPPVFDDYISALFLFIRIR